MFLLAEELSGVFNNVFKTLTNVISFTEVKNQFLKSLENAVKYQIYKQTFYSSTGRMFVHNFGTNVIRTYHYFKNVSWAESRWWWWSCVRRGRMSWFLRTDQIIYFHARRSKVSWWETGRGVKRGKQHISHVMSLPPRTGNHSDVTPEWGYSPEALTKTPHLINNPAPVLRCWNRHSPHCAQFSHICFQTCL